MAEPGEFKIKTNHIEEEYQIFWNKKLGSGISGPVRICQSRSSGEEFAFKCLLDRAKSRQEAELHWKCSGHPHIVACVDVFQNELVLPGESQPKKCILMVLEMMKGGELFDRIRKKISFTEKEASEITMQVSSAMFHIHSLNIAHRDLKPENLLIKDKSEKVVVKLTDFGFAKIDKGNLMTPQFTPYYVSPQVLEAQKFHRAQKYGNLPEGATPYTYDKSCDVWSLGVIIYIMLCGYPPFYSENPRKQLSQGMKRRIMHGEYDFPAPEWSKVSDLAKDVVKRMLVISPNERITIQELIQHPWVSSETAPNTVLQSPHQMLDQNSTRILIEHLHILVEDEETKNFGNKNPRGNDAFNHAINTHSVLLADMRLPDTSFILNTNSIQKNPIVMKRKKAQQEGRQKESTGEESKIPRIVSPVDSAGIKSLRDMIAFLYMPPLDKKNSPTFEEFLRLLTIEALKQNDGLRRLDVVLAQEHWDGQEFTRPVNKNHFAKNLSDIVMHYHYHQNHPLG